ncbi:hypothetical protein ACP4OV_011809 [Aristida adscensionis]
MGSAWSSPRRPPAATTDVPEHRTKIGRKFHEFGTLDDSIPPNKRVCHNVQQPMQEGTYENLSRVYVGATSVLATLAAWSPLQLFRRKNTDRISGLPDDILLKILKLVTVREAAMTSCLSKSWRHLWENVDDLILDIYTFGMQVPANSDDNDENLDFWNSEATKFVNKANQLLHQHSGNGVKRLKVRYPLNSIHASEIDRWVEFAVASRAEIISFFLDIHRATRHIDPYTFPLNLFVAGVISQDLRMLNLCNCMMEAAPANLNGFACLESLSLNYVRLTDDDVQSIISSCHALHHLYLKRCHELMNPRISHSQLVSLEVCRCWRLMSIRIYAENLRRFTYMGHLVDIEYECAPFLCELNAFFVSADECPLDCIVALPPLQRLSLQFASRFQISRLLQYSETFANLKEVTLCILTSWKKSIRFVAYLFKAATLVETLALEVTSNLRPPNELKIRWPRNFAPTRLSAVRIGGFSGESELVQFVFFLLRGSPVLKTLLIDTHPKNYQGLGKWKRDVAEDARSDYGRQVAMTRLAPNIPSTVNFGVI